MASGIETLLFDLDGTLIDSAPSILAGFAFVLESAGIAPKVPLKPSLIGHPLIETLSFLSGTTTTASLDKLAANFKKYYDAVGCLQNRPYPETHEVLQSLHDRGVALHLTTNKRHTPTWNILNFLGWGKLFESVYTLDSPGRKFTRKGQMIAAQIADLEIEKICTFYVGDRAEDRLAADENSIGFIGVNWGYGAFAPEQVHEQNYAVINSMLELLALV